MACTSCGEQNREGAAFCARCGAPLTVAPCPACGATPAAGARFCDRCGAGLAEEAGGGRPAATSQRVTAPAAERRLVTVLFADAEGSTALTERIGDEEAYRLMQGCVTRMTEAVERHGGTISQFRGDGVMALFGAPVATEDSAVDAVTAALELQASLTEYRREVEARLGWACDFRVGLNTGPVVVGRLGDDVLVDYTAIGDTANVAARMEQAAEPGTVYLSGATHRAVADYIECEPVGDLHVKGKDAAITAWRATGRRRVRTRLDAAVARGLSRFVGRDHEIQVLDGLVQRAVGGQGAVVLMVGEAGIGKSRLLWELRRRLPAGVDWFEGRASAHGRHTPWLAVADLLRDAFGITEHDSPDEVAGKVASRAERWSERARRSVPYIQWLLHAGGRELDDLDPRERRAGAMEALSSVLLDGASRRPVVVAIEDLHWADDASAEAVEGMARSLARAPVVLVVTSRPGHPTGVVDLPWCTRLPLGELSEEQSAELAADVLTAAVPDRLRDLVAARAEGNPLFVEELLAALLEQGALERNDGRVKLAVELDAVDIPGTLQEVVLARVDRLEPEARHALQLASVIGREFTRRLLDRVVATDHLDGHLVTLESLELVRRTTWHPEVAYLFKHAVVHEVTYSTLLADRRRELHRVVAESIEDLYADRLHEHAEALARHWLEAGEPARALDHLQRAGERALEGFATAEAAAAYQQAAAIAGEIGDPARAIRLWSRLIAVCQLTTDLRTWIAAADAMRAAARALGDLEAEAEALAHRSVAELWLHDFARAEQTLEEARAAGRRAAAEGAFDGLVTSVANLRMTRAIQGGPLAAGSIEAEVDATMLERVGHNALAYWHQTDRLIKNWQARWEPPPGQWFDALSTGDRMLAEWTEALVAAGTGEYLTALGMLHWCVEQGERLGELLVRSRALNTLGWIHLELGDVAGAVEWNRRSLELVVPIDAPDPEIEANARLNLADCHLASGDLDAAAAELGAIERVVRSPTGPERWMLWRYSQHYFATAGAVARARGDHPAAVELADQCLDLAQRTDSRKYVLIGGRRRGEALAAGGCIDEAAAALAAAHALAADLGNPPQRWRSAAALGRLRRHDGDEGSARQLAADALADIDRTAAGLGDHPLAATVRTGPDATLLRELAGA